MLSFWEKTTMQNEFDCIIVGSGIVGLSAAAALKESLPQVRVLVLERGLLPTGASTKNAGFACFGSVTELLSDLEKMSEQATQDLVRERWDGLQLLRQRLGDDALDFLSYGGYELLFEGQEGNKTYLEKIDEINELLRPIFGEKVFEQKDELIEVFGFNPDKVKHLIYNHFEGQIDTGRMMQSLLNYVQSMGVKVMTGASVVGFAEAQADGDFVEVEVEGKLADEKITYQTSKLLLCTNAFTSLLLSDVELEPGRGQVLVTQPIEGLPFKGVFHYDEGYYYFRNFGNRIIFGGGRNLDIKGETTNKIETTPQIINTLQQHLKDFILPNHSFEVDHEWAGIMAFGSTKKPICKSLSENIFLGVRLGGMGVAIGSKLGQELANRIIP